MAAAQGTWVETPRRLGRKVSTSTHEAETWVDREVAQCTFKDARLGRRFQTLLKRIGSPMGESIPLV
jgi:Transposase DNA-binding